MMSLQTAENMGDATGAISARLHKKFGQRWFVRVGQETQLRLECFAKYQDLLNSVLDSIAVFRVDPLQEHLDR